MKDTSKIEALKAKHPALEGALIVSDSDAHYLEHISEQENFFENCEASAKAVINRLKNR